MQTAPDSSAGTEGSSWPATVVPPLAILLALLVLALGSEAPAMVHPAFWVCAVTCLLQMGINFTPEHVHVRAEPWLVLFTWMAWLSWMNFGGVIIEPGPTADLALSVTAMAFVLTVIRLPVRPVLLLAVTATVLAGWTGVVWQIHSEISALTLAPLAIVFGFSAIIARWQAGSQSAEAAGSDDLREALARVEQLEQELASVTDAARRSSDAKTALLANASHELRTPLNNIVGTTELMMTSATSEPFTTGLKSVYESSRSLVNLLNDLLNLARADSTTWSAQVETCSPRKLIDQLTRSFDAQCEAKGISVESSVDESVPPWVKVDVLRLTQVINNLIANALKFTEEGGIVVAVRLLSESHLEIRVRDTGPGIPASFHDRLFEPFEQAQEGRRSSGVGLGLAITKRIVDSMDGRIYFESTEGAGTTFFVHFPFAPAVISGRNVQTTGRVVTAQPAKSQFRVLYVDDNLENLKLASLQLDHLGYPHDTAASAMEAWRLMEHTQYDMILLDCQMPDMDGYELARKVRRESPNNHLTPIIAVTANALGSERYRCLSAGMDDYLSKPIQISQLDEAMTRWLQSATPAVGSGQVDSQLVSDLRQMSISLGIEDVQAVLQTAEDEMVALVTKPLAPDALDRALRLAKCFGLDSLAEDICSERAQPQVGEQGLIRAVQESVEDLRSRVQRQR